MAKWWENINWTSDIFHFWNQLRLVYYHFFLSDFPCYMTYRRHILQHPKCNSLDPKCNFRSSSYRSSSHFTHHISIIPLINYRKNLASGFTTWHFNVSLMMMILFQAVSTNVHWHHGTVAVSLMIYSRVSNNSLYHIIVQLGKILEKNKRP